MEKVIDRLPPIFATLGLIGLLVAFGLYTAGTGPDRFAIPVLAASLALLIYYVVERPHQIAGFFTGRSVRYGGNTLVMSLAFVAIFALINVLAARFSYRADLTATKDFTLSAQTIKVLTGLQVPVKLTAFFKDGDPGKQSLLDTVKQFSSYTDKVTTEYVDPDLKPGLARQFKIDFAGTTVLQSGDKTQNVMGTSEGDLISGILKVTRGDPRKVYFIIGHGEPDPAGADQNGFSGAKQALEAENYQVESLNLASTNKVPDDSALVILAAPSKSMLPTETQALTTYLDNGGKALILADPQSMAGLPELADRYGVEIGKGYVIETGQSLPNEPLVPIISGPGYLSSPITRNMPTMTVFPMATMVRAKKTTAAPQYTVDPLAQTTARSWLETDMTNTQPQFDPTKDVQGPISIAASVITADQSGGQNPTPAANEPAKKTTRLVVIGDVVFATNNALNLEGNRDFLVNSVNWLAEEEDLISVRAKAPADNRLVLTGGQSSLVLYSSVFLLPLAVLGVGAWIWWGKR